MDRMRRMPTVLDIIQPLPTADCGGCTACCDVLGVRELGKPYYARCAHLESGRGCGIYADRPPTCSAYRCAWHLGLLGESIHGRPDQSGILMQIEPENGEIFLEIYEAAPQAFATAGGRVREMVQRIVANERVRRLRAGHPFVRLYPFGSDIAIQFPVSELYDYQPPPADGGVPMWSASPVSDEESFRGKIRPFLMPRS